MNTASKAREAHTPDIKNQDYRAPAGVMLLKAATRIAGQAIGLWNVGPRTGAQRILQGCLLANRDVAVRARNGRLSHGPRARVTETLNSHIHYVPWLMCRRHISLIRNMHPRVTTKMNFECGNLVLMFVTYPTGRDGPAPTPT